MHVGLGLGLTRGQGGGVFSPSDLFQSGDILLWYDPSDLTTMFKDTAGTQPVTADGDSVALMLDKGQLDGRGIVNLLLQSGNLANSSSPWGGNTTFTIASRTSYLAGQTAYRHTGDGGGSRSRAQARSLLTATQYAVSAIIEEDTAATFDWGIFDSTAGAFRGLARYTWATNTISAAAGTLVSSSVTDLGTGPNGGRLRLLTATVETHASNTIYSVFVYPNGSGAVTTSTVVHHIQLEQGSLATAPQVNGTTVGGPGYHRTQATGTSMPKYKTDGTLHWLLYDGTDDSYQTPTITWGTKQVAHAFGIMANSDTTGVIAELSANYNSTAGAFLIARLTNKFGASTWNGAVAGGYAGYESTAYAAPTTKVIVSNFNLAGNSIDTELVAFRINGASDKAAAQGIYTDANPDIATAVLNFGRRNNASLPLNGREYQSIIRSRMWTNAELSRIERFIATKSGVTI